MNEEKTAMLGQHHVRGRGGFRREGEVVER